jgi:phosphohistidine phosphatase
MALYLVRHGESVPKEINPDCPLSDNGLVEVKRMAELAAEKNTELTKILHSGKKRAEQTAIIFRVILKPLFGLDQSIGLNPNDDIFYILGLIEQAENIMIVGHLPFLEKLASYLVTGDEEEPVVQFQTAGIVCLDKDDKGKWEIKWTLMPYEKSKFNTQRPDGLHPVDLRHRLHL